MESVLSLLVQCRTEVPGQAVKKAQAVVPGECLMAAQLMLSSGLADAEE